jgi:hypothetical protein
MPRPVADVRRHEAATQVAALIRATCAKGGLTPTELWAGSRRGQFPRLLAALACRLVAEGGLSLAETARHLGVSTPAIIILRKTEA